MLHILRVLSWFIWTLIKAFLRDIIIYNCHDPISLSRFVQTHKVSYMRSLILYVIYFSPWARDTFPVDNLGLSLLLLCSLVMYADDRVHYGLMVVLVCLHITPPHYHHYTDVLEGIGFLKFLPGIFCRVCVWYCQFSQLSLLQYMGLCVVSLPIYLMLIVRIRVL